jgi:hypothetical protein
MAEKEGKENLEGVEDSKQRTRIRRETQGCMEKKITDGKMGWYVGKK